MVQIIPTLFSTTEEEYKKRIDKLLNSSFSKDGWVQLDLMDNNFVPNLSINLDVIRKYPLPFKKEAQLMVIDPDDWIDGLIDLNADRIIFPIEIDENILDFINKIKDNNIEVGLSLNPETETGNLDSYIDLLDSVLLMGVKPGLEHQKLNTGTFQKIMTIKQKVPSLKIGVDGGINDRNARELVNAGADYLAIGSYLFNGDINENLENLWEVIHG